MRRPIKTHLVNWSNRPVNQSNRGTTFTPSDILVKTPVNRSNWPVNRQTGRYTGRLDRFAKWALMGHLICFLFFFVLTLNARKVC